MIGRTAQQARGQLEVVFGGPERTRVVVVLAAVLAMSSADAATVGAAATQLRRSLHIDLTDIGLLVTVSSLVGAAASLPFGVLADRVKRTRTLGITVVMWGIAMLASAFSMSFSQLLLARTVLGMVTASAGPVVASLIGDYFPSGERGRVYSYILTGELLGAGIGFAVTGDVAALSWRAAFVLLALPTFFLARFIFRLPEPMRGGLRPLARDETLDHRYGPAAPAAPRANPPGPTAYPAQTTGYPAPTETTRYPAPPGTGGYPAAPGTTPPPPDAYTAYPYPYPPAPTTGSWDTAPLPTDSRPGVHADEPRRPWTPDETAAFGPTPGAPRPSADRGPYDGTGVYDGTGAYEGAPPYDGAGDGTGTNGVSGDHSADGLNETEAQRVARERGVLPDPARVLHEDPRAMTLVRATRYVLSIPTNVILIIASACGYFYLAGIETFGSEFTSEQYGVPQELANVLILVIGIGAIVGVLVGGGLSDYLLRRRYLNSRILVAGVSALLTAMLFVPAITTRSTITALPYLTLAGFALMAQNPAIDAARLDIVPPLLWGRAEGVRTLLRTTAQSLAPVAFGALADLLGGKRAGLQLTFLVMLLPLLANGIILLFALRTYPTDVATAAAAPPPREG
jgi:MFS family permease